MPSIMMVAELLFLFAILLSPLSSSFGYGQLLVDMATIVPSISIGTCSPLINGRSFAICCKASFLDGALVRLYSPNGIFLPYNLPVSYVSNKSLSLKCTNETIEDITFSCWRTEFESLYLVNLSSFDQTLHLGDWSCEAYIGSAKMTVSSSEVITRNDGLVETQVNQTVQLLWNVTKDYVVISPSNKVLVNVSGDVLYSKSDHVKFIRNNATGKSGIKLNNTSGSDSGMYIFQASNGVRAALSLQVQEKPTAPKVIYRNLHIEGYPKVASAILYCLSESQTKGPMMYEQGVEYKWNGLTSQTGLQVGLYGSGVLVWNVDCTKMTSFPISCNAQQYGLKSETTWIIPQNLCLMSENSGIIIDIPTTPAPDMGLFIGVTVASVVMIFLITGGVFLCIHCSHRRYGSRGCVSCRYKCDCSCCRRCCQATRNKFTAVFQAIRGYFHSTVTFIQYCHLRRRERNQNEENILSLPDTILDDIDIENQYYAVVNEDDASQNESGDGNEEDVTVDAPPSESLIEDERHLQNRTEARSSVVNADDASQNESGDGNEEDVTVDAPPSESPVEDERHVQNRTEARSSLDILHSILKHPPQNLEVRRCKIVKDVLNLFEDSSTGTHQIITRFKGECGADAGGVSREMIKVFWNEVKERYFHGNEVFVPHLRPERLSQKKDFVTLGRIFSLSTAILKSIPIQICRSTLMVIIYDTCEVDSDILLNDFLLFLDNEDRELVKSSLNSFDNMGDVEKGKLQEFFIKFNMGIVPRAAILREHMIDLAQNELCIKPKFFCENMRKGIPQNHMDHFWMQMTLDHLDCLYEDFLITAEHILTKIRCERWPLQNPNERRVFYYLRDLIQDLEKETLLSFVQFVTADRKIPSSIITVGFNDTQGFSRQPDASTCAYRLNIPRSYDNYEDFKNEFVNILKSDEVKLFSKN